MPKLSLELINNHIKYWIDVRNVWEEPVVNAQDDFYTFVYQKYLHENSTTTVTNIVNELGYRRHSAANHEVTYKSTDISDIIRNVDIENKPLQRICRDILNKNTLIVNKIWN